MGFGHLPANSQCNHPQSVSMQALTNNNKKKKFKAIRALCQSSKINTHLDFGPVALSVSLYKWP